MKLYTDIDQSKKLAEILPLESADMYWSRCTITDFGDGGLKVSYTVEPCNISQAKHTKEDIPCWGLASLLNELGKIKEYWFYHLIFDPTLNKYSVEVEANSWRYEGGLYDNAIDAVYETILKLHKQLSK